MSDISVLREERIADHLVYLCSFVTAADISTVGDFEERLSGPFMTILQADVSGESRILYHEVSIVSLMLILSCRVCPICLSDNVADTRASHGKDYPQLLHHFATVAFDASIVADKE